MGWRIAAAWALLGFAGQCFLAVQRNLSLVDGFQHAIVHYMAWGVAGFLVGTITERIIEESFRNRFIRTESDNVIATTQSTSKSTN
ncbi:hypothetical protein K2Y11_09365 [bacterium]|nr:hypothetical protein [bacterium]